MYSKLSGNLCIQNSLTVSEMENNRMEILNETVERKDVCVDELSLRIYDNPTLDVISENEEENVEAWSEESSNLDINYEGEDIDLGRIPVPVINTREGVIHLLEVGKDDMHYAMDVIRASTINFTPEQKVIIEKIEKEYEDWNNPNGVQMVNYFDKHVTELKDTLYQQEAQEEDFFEGQKIFYSCVYRALTRYPFPYSDKQLSSLESYKDHMDWATGDPSHMEDVCLIEELQQVISLMEHKDYKNCSTYYVECTVEYYVQQIIDDLYSPAQSELKREVPERMTEVALVNVASYVIMELKSIFHGKLRFCHTDLFHLGLSQIYTRMVNVFRFSGLLFPKRCRELMKGMLWEIEEVVRNPTTERYEMLHLGFYGFMDELRREHQAREMKEVDGERVFDEEGHVVKAIKKIMRAFYELQIAAEEHHRHFENSIVQVPDITKTIFRYFLTIFPPDQKIPITFMLPNGYYVSLIAREWVHQP